MNKNDALISLREMAKQEVVTYLEDLAVMVEETEKQQTHAKGGE